MIPRMSVSTFGRRLQKLSVEMFGAAALNTVGSGEEHSCEDIDWGPGQASPRGGGRGGWGPFSTRSGRGRGGRGVSMRGRGESPSLQPVSKLRARSCRT